MDPLKQQEQELEPTGCQCDECVYMFAEYKSWIGKQGD